MKHEPTRRQIWSHVVGIESPEYQEARDRMYGERILRDMAVGLRGHPTAALTHCDTGRPTFAFMQNANAEYAARGGQLAHIGCVAEVLIALRKAGIDSLTD